MQKTAKKAAPKKAPTPPWLAVGVPTKPKAPAGPARRASPTELRLEAKLRTAKLRVKTLQEDLERARAKADLAHRTKVAAERAKAELKAARAALKRGSRR